MAKLKINFDSIDDLSTDLYDKLVGVANTFSQKIKNEIENVELDLGCKDLKDSHEESSSD